MNTVVYNYDLAERERILEAEVAALRKYVRELERKLAEKENDALRN